MKKAFDGRISFSMKDMGPLIEEVIGNGETFRMVVSGNSMTPFLRNNKDEVVFAPLHNRNIRRGDIVLFKRLDNTYVMHRIFRVQVGGSYDFIGDNQYFVEKGIRREQIIAYVPFVFRDTKKIDCQKGFLRWILTVYMLFRVYLPGIAYWTMYGVKKVRELFGPKSNISANKN